MAKIYPREKVNKIVSYKFKVYLGRDERGKQIFKCTNWDVPEGMTPAKARKAAETAAFQWELEIKDSYKFESRCVQEPQKLIF